MTRFIISFAGFTRTVGVRGSRRNARMYVYGVSWNARGSGLTKFSYGMDQSKAVTFAKTAAEQIVSTSLTRHVDVRIEPALVVIPVVSNRSVSV